MTAYKRPVFFDRDIKSFAELSADSGLDLGIVARSILADAYLQAGTSGSAGTVGVRDSSNVDTLQLTGATKTIAAYSRWSAEDPSRATIQGRVSGADDLAGLAVYDDAGTLRAYANADGKFHAQSPGTSKGSTLNWAGLDFTNDAGDIKASLSNDGLTFWGGGPVISAAGRSITNLSTAAVTLEHNAATKGYVDSVAQGLAPKGACHVSSQGNLADLATTTEVDGHTLSVGERVLVRYQSDAVQNGIYEFDGSGLVRTADMAAGSHAAGAFTFIQYGTNADQGWVCTADAPTDVVGTDALPWTQFSAAGVIEAGDGLQLIGTVMSAKLDGTTLSASADGLRVLGLPSLFEIDGSAVSAAVTAANLGTLVDGPAGDAAALHSHSADAEYLPAAAGLTAGKAAIISAAGEAATAGTTTAGAYMIGVCESVDSGSARIVRGGLAVGVLSGATAGDVYYVQANGTLSTALPSSGRVVMAGIAKSASDLHVQVRDFGSILAA